MSKPRLCGYCAAAPINSQGPFAAHMMCPGTNCACAEAGHNVNEDIADVQRIYTHGKAETDI